MLSELLSKFLFAIFLRIGMKFFPCMAFYTPGDTDDAPVRAIHFALSEEDLDQSMKSFSEGGH